MSNFKLWEIPAAIETVADMLVDVETGELISQEEANVLIEKLEEEKDKKVEYLCKLVKNYKAEAEALKAQKIEFERRQKAAERKCESIKNYIRFALGGEKWKAEDASVSISYKTTKNVVKVDDLAAVPSEYFKTPHTDSNLDRTALKQDILDGANISGIHLEDSVSVVIR